MGSRTGVPVILCFDSNILIDAVNGYPAASVELAAAEHRIISVISWIETLAGTRDEEEERRARRFLEAFEIVPVTHDVALATVAIRRSMRLKLPDAIVLATARVMNCQLSTRNTKDFGAGLDGVRVPYRL